MSNSLTGRRLLERADTRRSRKLIGASAVLALAVGGSVIGGSPAMAASQATAGCSTTYTYHGTQVQVDTCPGSGAASWAWIYSDPSYSDSTVTLTLANGSDYDVSAGSGSSDSQDFDSRIVSFVICNYWYVGWFPPVPTWQCSATVNV